jgi:hypothetical protein
MIFNLLECKEKKKLSKEVFKDEKLSLGHERKSVCFCAVVTTYVG